MSVLYIKSLGSELKEYEEENRLLKKIIKSQEVGIENRIRKLKTEVDKCHSFIEKQGMMTEYNRYQYEESEDKQ